MKVINQIFIGLGVLLLTLAIMDFARAEEELTGDTKLACEAILCLSSNASRPSECEPSLRRYFGIDYDKPWETADARRKFLGKCPNEEKDGKMDTLPGAIVDGAGTCDADHLNSTLAYLVEYQCNCREVIYYDEGIPRKETVCDTCTKVVIDNTMPQRCNAYANHGYTDIRLPTYVGSPMEGGKWVD